MSTAERCARPEFHGVRFLHNQCGLPNKGETERLRYFDHLRAIAILSIVMSHCFSGWAIGSFGEKMSASLVAGGTSLFVFISGFFFHNKFYANFSYSRFLIKKFVNLCVPYLAMSSAAFLASLFVHGGGRSGLLQGSGVWDGASQFLLCLSTCGMLLGYWYVPFIMIVFLLSPLFLRYITLARPAQIAVVLILLAVSTVAQRPLNESNPVHALIYFTPVYLLGILFSINKDAVLRVIDRRPFFLLGIVLGLSALKVLVDGSHANNVKASLFAYDGVDVLILQKIFLVMLLISILRRFENKALSALEHIASCSFAIFFLHPWALIATKKVCRHLGLFSGHGFAEFAATFVATLLLSIGCAHLVRFMLKRKSRLLIGW